MPSRHIPISSPRFWSLTRDACEAGNQEGSDLVMASQLAQEGSTGRGDGDGGGGGE